MKTEPIHIRPGLSLYKQPLTGKGGSRYWYARVRMKIGGRDLHAKSTGTTDETAARRFADSYFGECLLQRQYPDLVSPGAVSDTPIRRFDVVADQWLNQRKAAAGSDRRKLRGWDDARKLVIAPNGLGAFFKRSDIATITTDRVRDYLQFAADHIKKGELAPTTQRNHISTLSAILKYATERRLISAAPPMPRLRLKDNPRPCFNDIEFIELCAFARVLTRRAEYDGDHVLATDRAELQDFLTFMLATFLRAGEWKEIRQKHCRIVYGPSPYLEVSVPNGKTHKRRVVSMPEAIPVWERIIERDRPDPERFLFLDRYQNRETAQERMRDRFEDALNEAGLALDEFGHKRTVYSLRHTALMFRLLNGDHVDLLMLARNAGTSVDQLERFYLSHADPAMKVENLHSSRFPREFEEMVDDEPEGIRLAINLRASLDEPAFAWPAQLPERDEDRSRGSRYAPKVIWAPRHRHPRNGSDAHKDESKGFIMNKRLKAFSIALATSLTTFLFSTTASAGDGAKGNIVAAAVNSEDHQTLVAAVKAAGLVDTLASKGPFTLLAPTDAAFARLPAGTLEGLLQPLNRDKLRAVLTYHVVPGKVTSASLVESIRKNGGKTTLKTFQGGTLTARLSGGSVVLTDAAGGTATVTTVDLIQSNGIIHVTDAVSLPM